MKFRVAGTPAPQGSKRHVGGGRMVEQSKAVGPWREAIRAEAARLSWYEIPGSHDPVTVAVTFILKRPAGHYRTGASTRHLLRDSAPPYPAGRPDVDKLARAVLDGLVMGGVMADDSQVVDLVARKRYAPDGEAPGAVIEVEAM